MTLHPDVLRSAAISISETVRAATDVKFFGVSKVNEKRTYQTPKSEMFLPRQNAKCTLKPLRDERAREMHDDTAARSSCVAAGSVTLHPDTLRIHKKQWQSIALRTNIVNG